MVLVADMGDALGLTAVLSAAMAPTRQRRSAHDPRAGCWSISW